MCKLVRGADEAVVVYKPRRGERPLEDFPRGTLGNRERAAFLLSEASGWAIVPPTILRDGPFGPGAVQAWIDSDPAADVVEMVMTSDPRLRRICLFDVISNNADRKGSHLLPVSSGEIFGVDHGICFSADPKLRTVLWGWRGTPIDAQELDVVRRIRVALDGDLRSQLAELLSEREIRATVERAEALLDACRFPDPDPMRPAIPWPPF